VKHAVRRIAPTSALVTVYVTWQNVPVPKVTLERIAA